MKENNDKRVRIVVNDLGTGGTETHLSRILPPLVKDHGFSIKLFLLSDKLDLAPPLMAAGIAIWYPRLPLWLKRFCGRKLTRFLQTLLGFFRLVWDFCIDRKSTTHFFLARSYLVGMTAALFTFLPADKYLSRRSLNDYQHTVPGSRWLEKFFHQKVTKILVNSDKITAQLVKEEGVSKDHVIKIYNGLQTIPECYRQRESYRQQLLESYHIPSDAWIFITVANLIPYKGHEHLLKALSTLKEFNVVFPSPNLGEGGVLAPDEGYTNEASRILGGKPWYLLCVGTDAGSGYAAVLRQQASDLGIGDKIRWLGKQSDVFALYAGADVGFLCPYRNEGFSNALLEGMSIGLPFVVTDVGGNAEAVVQGNTGFVVPPKNPEAIATAIKTLCQQPLLCRQFGNAGRQRVEEKFTLTECVAGYCSVYQAEEALA